MELLILGAVAFVASLWLLYAGAKKTLKGAVLVANSIGVSRVVAGTVLVASITALPELMSSIIAVVWASSHLALGNLLGSNIYNVPLIIGLCGLVREFKLKNSPVILESAFMIALGAFFAIILALTGQVTWWMGIMFLALYPAFIYRSIRRSNNGNCNGNGGKVSKRLVANMIFGGAVLLSGTMLLVRSALLISEIFGLREFYVGLTISALGCIIPEAAVSLLAARAGEQEISVGNVIGDNIITITLVFGLVAIISAVKGYLFYVSQLEILSTVPFMVLVTVMLLIMSKMRQKITRPISVLMLAFAAASFIIQTMLLL
ncbi:MAG: sodium:calcium antiporter [Candidatus Bathyarchaeia archaeon]